MNEQKILTPIKAIRAKCLDCSNNQWTEVERCPVTKCALHPYKLGHRPGWEKKKGKDNIKGQEQDKN